MTGQEAGARAPRRGQRLAAVLCGAVWLAMLAALPVRAAQDETMRFTLAGNGGNCARCVWVAAEGPITAQTPQDFLDFVASKEIPALVALNSPGGNLVAGMMLGRMIREAGAGVMVARSVPMADLPQFSELKPGVCASACSFAFMGGVERILRPGDRLGMHQFYTASGSDIDSVTVQQMVGQTLLHALSMGIDARTVAAASFTRPEEMYWFSNDEAIELGLDNSTPRAEPWRLEPYKKGMVLTTTLRDGRGREAGVTLFCRRSGGRWSVLVSETGPLAGVGISGDLYPEGGLLPSVAMGANMRDVRPDEFEFERIGDGRVTVSVRLGEDPVRYAGQTLTFVPNLGGYLGALLYVSLDLPGEDWLAGAGRNCI